MDTIDWLPQDGDPDFNDLFDMSVHVGTIDAIDVGANTADVTVADGIGSKTGVEIFYNCEDQLTADGATAFTVGDSVYVTNKGGVCAPNAADLTIVGFVAGPKSCKNIIRMKLIQDGSATPLAPADIFEIDVYNSSQVQISLWDTTYDTGTNYWSLEIADVDVDPTGYFVDYRVRENTPIAMRTQYPFRYKTADKWQSGDLIQLGTYEDRVPYYVEEGIPQGLPEPAEPPGDDCEWTMPADVVRFVRPGQDVIALTPAVSWWSNQVKIFSSIPYEVTYKLQSTGLVTPISQHAAGPADLHVGNCTDPLICADGVGGIACWDTEPAGGCHETEQLRIQSGRNNSITADWNVVVVPGYAAQDSTPIVRSPTFLPAGPPAFDTEQMRETDETDPFDMTCGLGSEVDWLGEEVTFTSIYMKRWTGMHLLQTLWDF